jgi:hypothetical protein
MGRGGVVLLVLLLIVALFALGPAMAADAVRAVFQWIGTFMREVAN